MYVCLPNLKTRALAHAGVGCLDLCQLRSWESSVGNRSLHAPGCGGDGGKCRRIQGVDREPE